MIHRLIEWSAKNHFLVLLGTFFATLGGIWAIRNVPLDAIPDLSDVQVIIYTEWMGTAPSIIEDQVTYPITTAMLSAPRVKVVRGISAFGFSWVYVIFEDGTDLYWARTRVLEYLEKVKGRLPPNVRPILSPDATGVGWVFAYALVDKTGKYDLAQLRTVQDWYLKYYLESIPDVAEVATFGGFPKAYYVEVDPEKLRARGIPLSRVISAIRMSNQDVGAGAIELTRTEYMVRGLGFLQGRKDIENISLGTNALGTPIYLKDVARVTLGSDMRRGVADLNGEGDAVGGIVVMRHGKNALKVISRVKAALEEFRKTQLPPGMEIVVAYDRSNLILQSINTLKRTLFEESIIVILVCLIFLFSLRSSGVVILTLPLAVIISFIPMYFMGLTSNIMSLGGIAIAIGAMVDAAIVMIENVHKRLEHFQQENPEWEKSPEGRNQRNQVIIHAMQEVGKPLYYSLLVITVSFLPVFTLEYQEGRLFKPLAYTKTYSMLFASLLSITFVPAIMNFFTGKRVLPEKSNPISRFLIWIYNPIARFELRFRFITITLGLVATLLAYPAYKKLGSEFMPPLNEGTILYMPMTLPGISVYEARRMLQIQDKLLKQFPEVDVVLGKAGRATTATDPAPLAMVETFVSLKPENQWRKGMTFEKLREELDARVRLPGWANVWTMPIKNRVDMITTGIRTALGIKIFGRDLWTVQKIAEDIEKALKEAQIAGTTSIIAERSLGGYYLHIVVDREAAARYGLNVLDVQDAVMTLVGGMEVTRTIEGRERYPVIVRYPKDLRLEPGLLNRVLLDIPSAGFVSGSAMESMGMPDSSGMSFSAYSPPGGDTFLPTIPLSQVAKFQLLQGPDMIRGERGLLTGTVYVDVDTTKTDIGTYVQKAQKVVEEKVKLPDGYFLKWSGQYEYMERVREKLKVMVPLTLFLIFLLMYLNFGSITKTLIVMLSVPFALTGSMLGLSLMKYHLSVAVWVGIIALAGVAAETGVVMLVYVDEAYERYKKAGRMRTRRDLYDAIIEGAVQRVRPKMMTVMAVMMGLLPILWSHGAGADVMQRIATPMIGGMVTSTILTLFTIPSIYYIWKSFEIPKIVKKEAQKELTTS
ncbi:MAG: efflux RND transporter permease subunit [bacterium JZ-2024 1]